MPNCRYICVHCCVGLSVGAPRSETPYDQQAATSISFKPDTLCLNPNKDSFGIMVMIINVPLCHLVKMHLRCQ
jgi:hypothetical protein